VLNFYKVFKNNNAYLLLLFYCSIAGLLIKFEQDYSLQTLLARGIELRAGVSQRLSDIYRYLQLNDENEKLALQNSVLLAEIIEQGSVLRDSASINRTARFIDSSPISFIHARVVERRFNTNENLLIINAGIKQGVEVDMAVMTPDGLVGRVIQVSNNYAKVMPVIHAEFSVSVVSDSNSTQGILSWNGKQEQLAQMHYVPLSSSIGVNENIYTADFSTFAIRGIPVGQVLNVKPDQKFYRVDVRLGADFSSLNRVLVVKKTTDPEKKSLMENTADEDQILEKVQN